MNPRDWLRKQVRVYSGVDRAKEYAPMAEGEVIGYIDGPSIIVRDRDGHQSAWPVSLPIDVVEDRSVNDELYRIAKERAEGKRPNVPWRKDETDEQRRARWNAANPQDPIPEP